MMEDFQEEHLEPKRVGGTGNTAAVRRKTTHLRTLAKISEDERLMPNRRLLACILAMQLDAEDEFQKNLYAAVLLGEFVSRAGLRLYDPDDKRTQPDPKTKIELEADANLRRVFEASLNNIGASLSNLRDGLGEGLTEQLGGVVID